VDVAGVISKAFAAAATGLAPVGVYSLLTLHGAGKQKREICCYVNNFLHCSRTCKPGYMSIMQTLAYFGGGSIVSGGGGVAAGVGVIAVLAVTGILCCLRKFILHFYHRYVIILYTFIFHMCNIAGVYTSCICSYATVNVLHSLLVSPEANQLFPYELEVLSVGQSNESFLAPLYTSSLLAEEVRNLFLNRSTLHEYTLIWEIEEEMMVHRYLIDLNIVSCFIACSE
jgi:hypothetical protein